MNSCGNTNASTKLRGSKVSEARDEQAGISEVNNEEKGNGDGEGNTSPGFDTGDSANQRQALLICQRNSTGSCSERPITRFKSRYIWNLRTWGGEVTG